MRDRRWAGLVLAGRVEPIAAGRRLRRMRAETEEACDTVGVGRRPSLCFTRFRRSLSRQTRRSLPSSPWLILGRLRAHDRGLWISAALARLKWRRPQPRQHGYSAPRYSGRHKPSAPWRPGPGAMQAVDEREGVARLETRILYPTAHAGHSSGGCIQAHPRIVLGVNAVSVNPSISLRTASRPPSLVANTLYF